MNENQKDNKTKCYYLQEVCNTENGIVRGVHRCRA